MGEASDGPLETIRQQGVRAFRAADAQCAARGQKAEEERATGLQKAELARKNTQGQARKLWKSTVDRMEDWTPKELGLGARLEAAVPDASSAPGADSLAELGKWPDVARITGQNLERARSELNVWRQAQATARTRRRIAAVVGALVLLVALFFGVRAGYHQLVLFMQYQGAAVALEAKDWPKARTELATLLKAEPNYRDAQTQLREAYYRPALAAFDAQNWEAARSELTGLSAVEPNYKDSRTLMRESYYQPAKAAFDAQKWDLARDELTGLSKIDSNYKDSATRIRESYYQPAKAAFDAEEWAKARDAFAALVALDPTYRDAAVLRLGSTYCLAKAELQAGNWDGARKELQAVLTLDAKYQDAPDLLKETYYRPAVAALQAENWKEAAADLFELTKLDPGYKDTPQLLQNPKLAGPLEGLSREMVLVLGGEFLMGSADGDYNAYDNEKPRHPVLVDAFWIDKYEVTNEQYLRCVSAGACRLTETANDDNLNGNRQPVAGVTWRDASTYCTWIGGRLPTEAEWEKAACGTGGWSYPWGNGWDISDANMRPYGPGKSTAVGSYPDGISPYGALDMGGNVFEWVADLYGPYPSERQVNPAGPASGLSHVLRGGSWNDPYVDTRCVYREDASDGGSRRLDMVGFRVVLSSDSRR